MKTDLSGICHGSGIAFIVLGLYEQFGWFGALVGVGVGLRDVGVLLLARNILQQVREALT
ncbi:MAG: hypothetical protein ABSH36_15735 [Solirubrobacteraceae bacterium]|jgi:hypothetical protein